jgi:hypothetical protein
MRFDSRFAERRPREQALPPLFVEGLHGLAPFYPELGRWHECVASPPEDLLSRIASHLLAVWLDILRPQLPSGSWSAFSKSRPNGR